MWLQPNLNCEAGSALPCSLPQASVGRPSSYAALVCKVPGQTFGCHYLTPLGLDVLTYTMGRRVPTSQGHPKDKENNVCKALTTETGAQ